MHSKTETDDRQPQPSFDKPPIKPQGDSQQARKEHQEDLLDEAVEETFPASDPVSVKRIT